MLHAQPNSYTLDELLAMPMRQRLRAYIKFLRAHGIKPPKNPPDFDTVMLTLMSEFPGAKKRSASVPAPH